MSNKEIKEYNVMLNNEQVKVLVDELNEKDKEIERLKKENKKYNKWIESLNKDNHRLNNIINELEKYSENMIVDYNEAIEEAVDNIDRFNLLGARSSYREISNKIKELKGSDKE